MSSVVRSSQLELVMLRRFLTLTAVLSLVIGCSRQKGGPAGGGGGEGGVESNPNAEYTLKLRPVQEGDKTDVIRSESTTTEIKRGAKTEHVKHELQFEYLEQIQEMPAGATLPTKLTRTYHTARRTDPRTGQLRPLPFHGKTVTFEKKGSTYSYTIDGKPVSRADVPELDAEFRTADKVKTDALLPDRGVKVGDSWTVRPEILKSFGDMGTGIDLSRSQLNCRLTRAYTKDGHQWGAMAFEFELVLGPKSTGGKSGGESPGTIKVAGTFDAVIDGSARDSVMKGTVRGEVAGKSRGSDVKTSVDGSMEKTVRTAR